jgi:hypothetical protein
MTENEKRPYTAEETEIIRKRQSGRAKIMALILVAMCALFYGLTIVKLGNWK